MNKYYKFDKNIPNEDIWVWWNEYEKHWELWFGDAPPQYSDDEYSAFKEKAYHYEKVQSVAALSDAKLIELKDAIGEEVEKRHLISEQQNAYPEISPEELEFIVMGDAVSAIKSYRFRNKVGLKEAKMALKLE